MSLVLRQESTYFIPAWMPACAGMTYWIGQSVSPVTHRIPVDIVSRQKPLKYRIRGKMNLSHC